MDQQPAELVQESKAPKRKTRPMLVLALIVVVLAAVGGYFWQQNSRYESSDNAQLDGNIEQVRASVTAYVDKIYFTDNQQVKPGDTLVRFNTVALQARVQQATAALENARASVRVSGSKATASVENATASLQLAQSNRQAIVAAQASVERAKEELTRTTNLLKIKAATQQQFENTRTQLQLAQAEYAQAVSRQQSSLTTAQGLRATAQSEQGQIGTAQALVKQREAELTLAQEDLRHAFVLAPCAGIVTKRTVQTGQYVSAGQNLCAVVDWQHLWVTANVKETQLGKIKPGQPVEVRVDAYPDLHLMGRVASFGGATGAKFSLLPPDNATGNFIKIVQRFPIRIALDAATLPTAEALTLYPGLSAAVKIETR